MKVRVIALAVAILSLYNASSFSMDDIFRAALNGNLTGLQTLIARNPALASERDGHGNTPLHLASEQALHGVAERVQREVVLALIGAHANVNETNDNGETPLHVAARSGSRAVVEALIGAGAHIEQSDANLDTPLHIAAENGNLPAVQALIAHHANVNARDVNGVSAWRRAHMHGYVDICRAIRDAGGDAR